MSLKKQKTGRVPGKNEASRNGTSEKMNKRKCVINTVLHEHQEHYLPLQKLGCGPFPWGRFKC